MKKPKLLVFDNDLLFGWMEVSVGCTVIAEVWGVSDGLEARMFIGDVKTKEFKSEKAAFNWILRQLEKAGKQVLKDVEILRENGLPE